MCHPEVIEVPVRDLVILPAYYSIGREYFSEPIPIPDEDIIDIAFYDELTRHLSETEGSR